METTPPRGREGVCGANHVASSDKDESSRAGEPMAAGLRPAFDAGDNADGVQADQRLLESYRDRWVMRKQIDLCSCGRLLRQPTTATECSWWSRQSARDGVDRVRRAAGAG